MADIETPRWRDKHKIGNLMSRIEKHANGEIEMTMSQINAAKLFLSKTLPDLNKTELLGDPEKPLFGNADERITELARKAGINLAASTEARNPDETKV